MTLIPTVSRDVLTPEQSWREAAELTTPFSQHVARSFGQGFDEAITGRVIEEATTPGLAPVERAGQGGIARGAAAMQARDTDRKAISQPEWRNSRWWRDGIPFQEGMTEPRAQALAESYDYRRWRDTLYQRYQGGAAGRAAGIAAQMLGSAASPENYIPILGPAARAAAVARFGRIAGPALVSGAEGAIGNLAVAPIVYPSLNVRGEDLGAADLAIDIGFGALVGGGFGGISGALAGRQAMRERGRVADAHAVLDALNAAQASLARNEPVDVGAIAGPAADRAGTARAAVDRIVAGEAAPTPAPADRVFTAAGRAVDVAYEVVEADSLIASNTDDLAVNPAFPAEMQPRDRTRAASADQIGQMAANLNPALLGRSATAADGAPIVGADGVVESGNGRVSALRRAYSQHPERAAAYRAFIEEQGFSTEGMTSPVLVRRRQGEMAPADRAAFAREANERTTAAMSTAERAMTDAAALDHGLMDLLQGSDVRAASNRAFVRSFIGKVASESDRGSLLTADGELSKAGAERVRNALLARAYGDADLVARLAEEPESGLGSLGQALLSVAPQWARMRALARSGAIAPEGDGTRGLMEAARSIVRERDAGNPPHFALLQQDMLSDGLSRDARAFLASWLTVDKRGNSRLSGQAKIADRLSAYADAAMAQQPGANLFGLPPQRPADLIMGLGQVPSELTAAVQAGRIVPLDPATETIPPPHPSIATGASRAKASGDELAEFAADAGLDREPAQKPEPEGGDPQAKGEGGDGPEVASSQDEFDILGIKVSDEDRAALKEADELVAKAEQWGAVYDVLPVCVTRFS